MRIPVIAGCAVCVPLVWILSLWLAGHAVSVAAGPLTSLRGAAQVAASFGTITAHIIQSIPREWLLGGLIAAATLYASLFGLIAVGYSLLYPRPQYAKAHLTCRTLSAGCCPASCSHASSAVS